jgi:uncharacterized protein (DUF4415 family)
MKKMSSNQLSPEQETELAGLATMPDEEIDTRDIPERFDWRGVFYRPIKQQITLRLDADLIAWFKEHGEAPQGSGYQTRINRVLREYVAQYTTNG